jgi:TRAP-type C4-dicarboxylate transport system substrate-binding protein
MKPRTMRTLITTGLAVTALALAAGIGAAPAQAKNIVWKFSGHGPASDPSQIYHDKLCNAITEAHRWPADRQAVCRRFHRTCLQRA